MSRISQITLLETVYPPFKNSNVGILTNRANENIAQQLRRSNFYMIGARSETVFTNYKVDKDNGIIHVSISVGGEILDSGSIIFSRIKEIEDIAFPNIIFDKEAILIGTRSKGSLLFQARLWLTPDSIYWNLSRGAEYLDGFHNHRAICKYDLLYVGIANNQDSYTRLLKKGITLDSVSLVMSPKGCQVQEFQMK